MEIFPFKALFFDVFCFLSRTLPNTCVLQAKPGQEKKRQKKHGKNNESNCPPERAICKPHNRGLEGPRARPPGLTGEEPQPGSSPGLMPLLRGLSSEWIMPPSVGPSVRASAPLLGESGNLETIAFAPYCLKFQEVTIVFCTT